MTIPWVFSCGLVRNTMKPPTPTSKNVLFGPRQSSQRHHCITSPTALCLPCYIIPKTFAMISSLILPCDQRIALPFPLAIPHFIGILNLLRGGLLSGLGIWFSMEVGETCAILLLSLSISSANILAQNIMMAAILLLLRVRQN